MIDVIIILTLIKKLCYIAGSCFLLLAKYHRHRAGWFRYKTFFTRLKIHKKQRNYSKLQKVFLYFKLAKRK